MGDWSSDVEIMRLMEAAHEAGLKIEIHQGLGIWELLPTPDVTLEIARIQRLIRHESVYPDMAIRFPDGSTRRPDLSIFVLPPQPTYEATRSIPEAVIEVVSPGSEIKDLELSPTFYLLHGVKDVVVFEPRTGSVSHFRRDGRSHHTSPVEIALECGCAVTV